MDYNKTHTIVMSALVICGMVLPGLCGGTEPVEDIHMAVLYDNRPEVERLLKKDGTLLNAGDHCGNTPLLMALSARHKELAEWLIAKGADINAKDDWGWTPLHWAAWVGYKDVAEVLIVKGADVNAREKRGHTPLHWAASAGPCGYKEIVELLLAKGADVNAKSDDGRTAIDLAIMGTWSASGEELTKRQDILKLLKKTGGKE